MAWKEKDDFLYDGVYDDGKKEAAILKFPQMLCAAIVNPVAVAVWKDVNREEAMGLISRWMESLG